MSLFNKHLLNIQITHDIHDTISSTLLILYNILRYEVNACNLELSVEMEALEPK